MGAWGIGHWLVVALVVMVLFGGRGKISGIMGDFAQGIKAFKKGLSEDETAEAKTPGELKSVAEQTSPKVDKTAEHKV
ncbi:MAG: twin-arginine translocase TatA/TatE family subunit [Beijerinckiaceae bacterium]|nr:twin-arginine translocase TatA/TatE family subunit [Beijerinckiaceae bacterium]